MKVQQIRSAAAMEAEAKVDRNCHALVVQSHGRWGGMPAKYFDWHADLRRHKLRLYGSLLRWVDVSLERSTTLAMLAKELEGLLHIPSWFREYILERADDVRRALRNRRAFGAWTHDGTEIK